MDVVISEDILPNIPREKTLRDMRRTCDMRSHVCKICRHKYPTKFYEQYESSLQFGKSRRSISSGRYVSVAPVQYLKVVRWTYDCEGVRWQYEGMTVQVWLHFSLSHSLSAIVLPNYDDKLRGHPSVLIYRNNRGHVFGFFAVLWKMVSWHIVRGWIWEVFWRWRYCTSRHIFRKTINEVVHVDGICGQGKVKERRWENKRTNTNFPGRTWTVFVHVLWDLQWRLLSLEMFISFWYCRE